MSQTRFDVLTIGNAIVDILAPVDEAFLETEGMTKGIMHLVDQARSDALFAKMPPGHEKMSGGSAGNTAAFVAALGGRSAFVGKLADDALGDFYEADFRKAGIGYTTARLQNGPATGRCMIFTTPDGERTMNTFLGACQQLTQADIVESDIAGASLTYMEGFLWDEPEAKKAFVRAAQYAHKNERATAFTLSDPFCVNRFRDEFLDLIRSQTVDYVFANVEELKSLYQTQDLGEAVRAIAKDAEMAAITMGADGAMAIFNGEIVSVPAFPTTVVDATGAGDAFAAGFLLAVARGQDMQSALSLGCFSASEVISHWGARPLADIEAMAGQRGLLA